MRGEWAARLESERGALGTADDHRLSEELARVRAELEEAANLRVAAAREEAERAASEKLDALHASAAEARERLQAEADAELARLRIELQAVRDTQAQAVRAEEEKSSGLLRRCDELNTALLTGREQWLQERASLEAALAAATAEAERHALERRAVEARLEQRAAAAEQALVQEHAGAAASLHAAERAREEALTVARAAERQLQLSTIERTLASVRAISDAKSLTDVLGALVHAAGTEAPRVAVLIVNGQQLQLWKAVGFGEGQHPSAQLTLARAGILGEAVQAASVVSTSAGAAPEFADLPDNRAAIAVPITVGGQSVAVLYADDGADAPTAVPASWPELVQILGRHAAVCLSHLTAVRTAQAMRATARPAADAAAATNPSADEANSARRYARLLVSEIKLYNEAAVRMGRERRDILARLRPEIDRARRLYEERVPATIGARAAYFHQELVHTLADGDAGLLGGSA